MIANEIDNSFAILWFKLALVILGVVSVWIASCSSLGWGGWAELCAPNTVFLTVTFKSVWTKVLVLFLYKKVWFYFNFIVS